MYIVFHTYQSLLLHSVKCLTILLATTRRLQRALITTSLTLLLSSCGYDLYTCTFPDDSVADCAVKPIYLPWTEIIDNNPVKVSSDNATAETQTLINAGYSIKEFQGFNNATKIYTFNDILLVNERFQGVYVFDNSDPSSPMYRYFFKARGATDMAVYNGFVYINNFANLLSFELTKPDNWSRTEGVLDYQVDESFLPIDVRFANVELNLDKRDRIETPIELDYTQGAVIGYTNSNNQDFFFQDNFL